MQQNQKNQQQAVNQNNHAGGSGPSDKFGHRQGINPGYVHFPSDEDNDTIIKDRGVDEIPGEHHNKEGQPDFTDPIYGDNTEQHERSHTGASFPKQDPATGPDGKPVSNGKVF